MGITRTPTRRALGACVLALLLGLLAPAVARADEATGVDVVFLVDASGSVQATDPTGARGTALRAITDLALRRGGDRIAIFRFAGRSETQERARDALTLDLTEIPTEPTLREDFLEQLHAAIGTSTEIFPGATATDFNAAFELGLGRILNKRKGARRPLWVILLSDGDSEVERGKGRSDEYAAEAAKRYGKTLTRYLNKAATDLLREKVLPKYDADDVYFTAINVAALEVADGDALTAVATQGNPEGSVLRVTERPVRDLIMPAFRAAPGALGRPVAQGIAYEAFELESSVTHKIRTCGRLGRTGVLVFGPSKDFRVSVVKPDGSPLGEGSIDVSGRGERYRVVTIAGLPAGEYGVRVEADRPGSYERLVYHELDVAVAPEVVGGGRVFRPGETVTFDLSLRDVRANRAVTDSDVLSDFKVAARVHTPAGEISGGEASLADPKVSRLELRIPETAARGPWVVDLRTTGLTDPGGESGVVSEAKAAARLEVVPALTVSWSAGEVEEGAGALLQGTPPAGSLPSDLPIPVRLTSGDASRTITMKWDAKRKAWVGKGPTLPLGTWKIGTPADAGVEIVPGSISSLAVVAPPAGFADRFPWLPILLGVILLAAVAMLLLMRRRRRFVDAEEYEEPDAYGAAAAATDGALFGDEDDLDDEILLDDEGMEDYVADVERRQEETIRFTPSAEDDEDEDEDDEEILDLETIILDD